MEIIQNIQAAVLEYTTPSGFLLQFLNTSLGVIIGALLGTTLDINFRRALMVNARSLAPFLQDPSQLFF